MTRMSDEGRLERGECPDCLADACLLNGPRGGMARDVLCCRCFSEFVVSQWRGTVIFVDRLGKASAARARAVYGIGAVH